MKRLITNKLLILNFISGFFWTFAMSGFTTFAPKFFEVNFQLKRSSASGYFGAVGPLSKGIGLLGSGKLLSPVILSRFFSRSWNTTRQIHL